MKTQEQIFEEYVENDWQPGLDAQAAELPAYMEVWMTESGYWAGFQAYCNGLALADLTDPAEVRGWWGALSAEANCDTCSYLQEGH